MRKALVSVLLLFAFSSCFSQTFSLKDTNVTSGYYRSYSIVFPLGSVIPLPECSLHLDSIVAFLVKNPSLQIEIGVHFDSRASASASSNKSKARANSLKTGNGCWPTIACTNMCFKRRRWINGWIGDGEMKKWRWMERLMDMCGWTWDMVGWL